MPKVKTGIMGGTFNPIHNGHLLLAEQAREFCRLDSVLFMPSGNSYMKESDKIPSGDIRAAMTALAIKGHPDFFLSTIEIEREGNTYTYETLDILKKQNPEAEYYFIMGADNLFSIENWKEPKLIFENCILVAAVREEKGSLEIQHKASELQERYSANIILLPARRFDVSSSEIRGKISRGESVRYLLPDSVAAYIERQQLYRV